MRPLHLEPARDEPALETSTALDEIAATARPAPEALPRGPFVGDVLEARHPQQRGRARVRWRDERGEEREAWLATMVGIAVRVADRVLLQQPVHWSEPLVAGVVDGFSSRPPEERTAGPSLALAADERVTITAADGTPLVDVFQAAQGPVVRLRGEDVAIELPGRLRVDARSIELVARQGAVKISATDEVAVEGEVVTLN
jgi:hypothetical protein